MAFALTTRRLGQRLGPWAVRWADTDANNHMRHSAYFDYAAQARVESMGQYFRMGSDGADSAILFREEIFFLREAHLMQTFSVDLELFGLSADQRKWGLRHTFLSEAGEPLAVVEAEGAFFNIPSRKLVSPSGKAAEWISSVPRSKDFASSYTGPTRRFQPAL